VNRVTAERVAALAILAFSLGYFLLAFGIRVPMSSDDSPLSARSLPFALGVAGMALAAILVVRPPVGNAETGAARFAWGRAASLFVLMGLFALAIPHLGFVVTSALFLAAGFVVLGERRPLVLLPVAVVTAFTFWLVFRLLDVHLDWGVFGRMFQ
jgi:putative tricarboxylic transport membrane protein